MFIFSNLATSIDGKIACRTRNLFHLGSPEDRRQMQVLRKNCDAVLMGANTLRSFKKPCVILGQNQQPVNVVISSTLQRVSPEWPFFKRKGLRRILFVSPSISPQKLKVFRKTSEVIFLKNSMGRHTIAHQVTQALEQIGIQRLLVEGGGEIMWDFVRSHLIDEFHVTLTPKIIGGTESPTLVDGLGFLSHEILNLKLLKCHVVGDEIFLVYGRRKL